MIDLRPEEETVLLLRCLAGQHARSLLADDLADANTLKAYELTGTATLANIVAATGFSAGKISGLWKRWEALGCLYKVGQQYRRP